MAMGVSLGSDGKGRRKAVDADLNLVPYIDLLTCMVAFLLITAVWSQLARLSVAQRGQGQGDEAAISDHLRVAVLVSAESFNVIVKDDQKPIPKRAGTYDYAARGRAQGRQSGAPRRERPPGALRGRHRFRHAGSDDGRRHGRGIPGPVAARCGGSVA
jgi:hypothetical protein